MMTTTIIVMLVVINAAINTVSLIALFILRLGVKDFGWTILWPSEPLNAKTIAKNPPFSLAGKCWTWLVV